MTVAEIEAVARIARYDAEYREKDTLVIISTVKDGKKLYMHRKFQEDRALGIPFRYKTHNVADQILQAAMIVGATLEVEPYDGPECPY